MGAARNTAKTRARVHLLAVSEAGIPAFNRPARGQAIPSEAARARQRRQAGPVAVSAGSGYT